MESVRSEVEGGGGGEEDRKVRERGITIGKVEGGVEGKKAEEWKRKKEAK